MAPWLTALIPNAVQSLFDVAEGWQERRKEEARARHEAKLTAIRQQDSSWKDEFVLLAASYPPISLFIPFLRENTVTSLEYISKLPEWAIGLWVAIALSVYGVQKVAKVKK